ncbi:MAG TPA: nucleotidyltransferase family protein [Chlamydiales bacterium]|nr:nucleotidyltransferase family protein [Chlamydiales bacterium]
MEKSYFRRRCKSHWHLKPCQDSQLQPSNSARIIINRIKKKVLPILKKHAVKRAAIFGSVARGEAKAKSDVDILIEYKTRNKSLFDLVDLKSDLEETLDRRVDLITYNSIYWRIREQILAEQVVIL